MVVISGQQNDFFLAKAVIILHNEYVLFFYCQENKYLGS